MTKGESKIDALHHVPLFEHCSKAQLTEIAVITDEIQIPAGRVLMREGEHASEFVVLVTGEVEVSRAGTTVATLGAGSFFGETALLTSNPRNATVTTTTSAGLLIIRSAAFRTLLRDVPSLWEPVARALAERLEQTDGAPH